MGGFTAKAEVEIRCAHIPTERDSPSGEVRHSGGYGADSATNGP